MTLSPEARQRLAVFEAVTVKHPRLEEADRQVTAAIEAHAGYTHLLLYGPSGVGKTTLVQRITRRLRAAEPRETIEPVVFIKAHPPDQESTMRLDYYQQILKALKHQVVVKELLMNISLTAKPGRTARFAPAWLELREAVEEALERLQVQAVIVDEAQHLLNGGPHYRPVDQLDWLKSMTNRTNVLHVLAGSYDLFASRNLNGQAARRGRDVHFPRYHVEIPAERNEFLGVLRFLLEQAPLSCDLKDLSHEPKRYLDTSERRL